MSNSEETTNTSTEDGSTIVAHIQSNTTVCRLKLVFGISANVVNTSLLYADEVPTDLRIECPLWQVDMCVYVCICIHTYIHTYIHIYIYIYIYIYLLHGHKHVCMQTCIDEYHIQTYRYVHVYVPVYKCRYVHVYVPVYMCRYVYVYVPVYM
jgi:hypothetical protein